VPVIRLINALLRETIKQSGSDIHFETYEQNLRVRMRIDGVLRIVLTVPNIMAPLIISRLKVMANIDISEQRLPQDGRVFCKKLHQNRLMFACQPFLLVMVSELCFVF